MAPETTTRLLTTLPISTIMPPSYWTYCSALVASAIAVVATIGFHRARKTTLAAPAAWCGLSSLVMAAVELGLALRGMASNTLTASLWHYAASIGAFCPAMAVLGAKRPQDRGWQWVVLSLWIILLAPAGHALAASTGTRLELSGLWRLMIAALMAMELLNYLPTRHALSALCVVGGQAMLLSPFLWGSQSEPKSRSLALLCLLAAACMALMRAPIGQVATKEGISMTSPLDAFNQRWRLFRDGWGAFWGLRILQRINQTAELSGWPVRLQWSTGFQAVDDRPLDDATVLHIKQMLDSLLRRFERP